MKREETLRNIFAAYINQQTLNDGAVAMVLVSEANPILHQEYLAAIDKGIVAAKSADPSIITIINLSGYRVSTFDDAIEILKELRKIYISRYESGIRK